MESEKIEKFKGFPRVPAANYWQYPRVMDRWWYFLTGSEQKILDYILRHTWGYKKTDDYISMRQISTGIITRAGKLIDRGCGIKHRKTIKKAIDGLVNKGFVQIERRKGTTTYFRLTWSNYEQPDGDKLNCRRLKSEQGGCSAVEPTIKDIAIEDITIKDAIKDSNAQEKINQKLQELRASLKAKGVIKGELNNFGDAP